MSARTPGPWEVIHYSGPQYGVGRFDDDQGWVVVTDNVWRGPDDARLIAAAPELLAACLRARGWLAGNEPAGLPVLEALERAIAKATGEAEP